MGRGAILIRMREAAAISDTSMLGVEVTTMVVGLEVIDSAEIALEEIDLEETASVETVVDPGEAETLTEVAAVEVALAVAISVVVKPGVHHC
jgi:hypothetical protein